MLNAFLLSLGQLSDRRIIWLLCKVFALTLILVGLLGGGVFLGAEWLIAKVDVQAGGYLATLASLATVFAALFAILIAVILFRIVAMLVINIFSDDVVDAVEVRHYPQRAEMAKPPSYALGLRMGIRSALRALGYNLLALPVYILLLVTGIGTAAAFLAVNALLIGRDLQDMIASRHVPDPSNIPPEWRLSAGTRIMLGLVIALLLIVPFINFLAPVLGAAMATHLVHQQRLKDAG